MIQVRQEVIFPKGSMVNLWGTDGKWDYLSYTENGITYYGYASSDYIGFT